MLTQEELLMIVAYRNQIRDIQRRMNSLKGSIRERLEAGYPVEPGPHAVELLPTKKGKRLHIY